MSSALKLVSKESKKNKNKQKIISRKHCHFNLYLHLIIIKKSYQHKEYFKSLITERIQQHTTNFSTKVGIHHGALPSSFKSISLIQKCLGFNALIHIPHNSCHIHLHTGQLQIHNIITHNGKIIFLKYRLCIQNSESTMFSLLGNQEKQHFP